MEKMHVCLTLTEGALGTLPSNENIYLDYIATKAPDEHGPYRS